MYYCLDMCESWELKAKIQDKCYIYWRRPCSQTFGSLSPVFQVPLRAEEITIPADVTPERVPTHIVDYSGNPSFMTIETGWFSNSKAWWHLKHCIGLPFANFRSWTVRWAAVSRNIKGWLDPSVLVMSAPYRYCMCITINYLLIFPVTGKCYLHSLLSQQQEVHWKGECDLYLCSA